jgi:hypothetical protein
MLDDDAQAGREGSGLQWLDLVRVHRAANEDTAIHLCALLQSAGIEARVQSAQVAAYDGVFSAAVGFWGHVMVPPAYAERARVLIADLLGADGAPSGAGGDSEA